jgi:phage gpG-like protein
MAKKLKGKGITPAQLAALWATLPNKFEVNLINFEKHVGEDIRDSFKKSFVLGRFNSAREFAWRSRSKSYSHSILNETGSLKDSITYSRKSNTNFFKRLFGIKSNHTISIYTDPSAFRGSKRQHGRKFCYAAIHNDPDGTHTYGRGGKPTIQRQFMGESSDAKKIIRDHKSYLFDGFPK